LGLVLLDEIRSQHFDSAQWPAEDDVIVTKGSRYNFCSFAIHKNHSNWRWVWYYWMRYRSQHFDSAQWLAKDDVIVVFSMLFYSVLLHKNTWKSVGLIELTATFILLNWWARHCSIRAINTTISFFWF
jgi:hypothetical protein